MQETLFYLNNSLFTWPLPNGLLDYFPFRVRAAHGILGIKKLP